MPRGGELRRAIPCSTAILAVGPTGILPVSSPPDRARCPIAPQAGSLCYGLVKPHPSSNFPNHFPQRQKFLYRRPPAAIFFLDDFLQRLQISRKRTVVIRPRVLVRPLRLQTPGAAKTGRADFAFHPILFAFVPYMLTRHDFEPLD